MTNENTTPPKPFKSDGCTLSPAFNFRHCCEDHDRKYWCGGTREQRRDADIAFRDCIRAAGHPVLGKFILQRSELPRLRWPPSPGAGDLVGGGQKYTIGNSPDFGIVTLIANDQAARAANNGALPPDLSVITKARKGGGDYVYALLPRYAEEPPADFELAEGMYYNEVFPGHQIAMNPPLGDDAVEYTDGTQATTAQMSKDVTTFLVWAAEPEMEERKRLGIKVMLFLLVLTGLLYALKRNIWSDLH